METKTANKLAAAKLTYNEHGKGFEYYGDVEADLGNNNIRTICVAIQHGERKEINNEMKLMCEAANACKTINPDNPMAAAKVLYELFKNAKELTNTLERFYKKGTVGYMWANELRETLKQVTE